MISLHADDGLQVLYLLLLSNDFLFSIYELPCL